MLSLNGELGKIQDLPKRQAIFPPHQLAAVRKAEKAATDSNLMQHQAMGPRSGLDMDMQTLLI